MNSLAKKHILRLGFIADNTLIYDGDEFRYGTGEWRYVEQLARVFDEVDVCTRIRDLSDLPGVVERYPFVLSIPNGTVHSLGTVERGKRRRVTGWIQRQWSNYRLLRTLAKRWDFAFLVMPGWPALIGWAVFKQSKWQYAVWARADWPGAARHRVEYRRGLSQQLMKVLLPIYLRVLRRIESTILYSASIRMSDGLVLAERYPDLAQSLHRMVGTTLDVTQFRRRSDTCTNETAKIVSVGSLVSRKGIDISLRAIAKLVDEGYDLIFNIVGDGPERERLELLARTLGIDHRIEFMGYVPNGPELWDLYHQADIFLLTSYSEGFPRVIYEALSQSTPVVVTNVGGISQFLEDEKNALLLEPGSVESTADALRRILSDAELRQRLVACGHDFALRTISNHPMKQIIGEVKQIASELEEER